MAKVQAIDRIVYAVLGVIALLLLIELVQLAPSEGDRAAEAFEQARSGGASDTQLCRSAKVVETNYRARGEGSEADQWQQTARIYCNGAALSEGLRPS